MEVTVVKNKINQHLSNIIKLVPSRPQIPSLANIYMEAVEEENKIVLRATDLEIGVEVKFGAKVTSSGSALVSGRILVDTITTMTGDNLDINRREII